jgi:hypothetical protein
LNSVKEIVQGETGVQQTIAFLRNAQMKERLEDHRDEDCPLCMEKAIDMILGHAFHRQCLHQQLDAKWSGVGIGFNYIQ